MTAANVIADARAILDDTSGTRYTDALCLTWLTAVQGRLFSMRPDCVLQEDDDEVDGIDDPAPVAETDDVLSVSDKWRPVLVDGLLAMAYQIDDDEAQFNPRGRAAMHEQRFIQGARES